MSVIQTVFDSKDTLDLFRPQNLYLKPISRLNVSVQLPQLKKSGAKISNWEVMERVKEMARPFNFSVFKVRELKAKSVIKVGSKAPSDKSCLHHSGGQVIVGVHPLRGRDRELRVDGSGANVFFSV